MTNKGLALTKEQEKAEIDMFRANMGTDKKLYCLFDKKTGDLAMKTTTVAVANKMAKCGMYDLTIN